MRELNVVERVLALESVELLRALSPDQLARIALIARQRQAAPGERLLAPDEPAEAMFVVVEGAVGLLRDGQLLETAGPGDTLGSWALFDDAPLPITAQADEHTTLLEIRREEFFDLLADNMEIAATLFSTLVRRFRGLLERPGGA
jgi:CRP-like cAMP-binding protein